ncbi:MAG TPA: NADH-quinone oxidoreductase subunit J [Polyangia bacterium]|nr:NADH-quinone oxidoreductase subunit J [Polyangia bacterium]
MGAAIGSPPGLGEQILFWVLAGWVVGGALFTMTRRNPVTAVMSLVGTFFALAATYASLSAHFLAIIQILVYAGAIMVLFIFVVMILNREEITPVTPRGLILRVMGIGAGLYLTRIFVRVVTSSPGADVPGKVSDTFGTVASIGDILFRDFLYPFEAVSLLLLVAIVGGVVISRSHQKEVAAEIAAERRKAIEEMAHAVYPAPEEAALEGPGAHHGSGGGGHH